MENTKLNNANQAQEIDVRKIIRIVLEHWWWFVVGVMICCLLGMAYYLRKAPKWTTDASIMLRQKAGGAQFDALSMLGLSGNSATGDEVLVLASRDLLYQAIDALNIWDETAVRSGLRWETEFRTPALSLKCIQLTEEADEKTIVITIKPTKSGYKVKTKIGLLNSSTSKVSELGSPIETCAGTIAIHANRPLSKDSTYRLVHSRRDLVVAAYSKELKIAQNKKESNIINLSISSPVPERDKALLSQLIEQYNLNSIVDKNMIATNTAAFIDDRMAIISSELADAEQELSSYKEKNNIADIKTQAQLFLEASSMEQRAMTEIETQLSLVEYVDEFLRDDTKRNNLIPANLGISDAALVSALSEYNALQLQRMRIQRTATEDNPVIEQMNAQLASMRQNIIASIGSVRESLRIRQRSLQAQDTKYNRKIKDAPEQEREYVRVAREQKLKESLYLYLYQKREENALMLAATSMPAKIIDIPQYNIRSKSPKLLKLLLVCFILGLMLPAGILYIFVLLNDTIDDAKEFERRVNASVLGQLAWDPHNPHIAIREGEQSASSELFRLLRTNLRFALPQDVASPVVLVTSCNHDEGKSYVSSNIALSLAILGKKVVLVGLDIRKPMLATYFNLNTKGYLTNYLAEPNVKLDDIIVPSGEHKNLDLIPCGTIPPNPSELLQTDRVDELFAELRKRYDYVIVDTAPVALVSDTYLLDRVADMTIFVSRYKYTPTEMIDYINQVVEQKRMHNVACVLNGVKGNRMGYGYGYGYGTTEI
ncbi:MAG: polysaccharide biosynthesis tyrosine autokinase [Paludibacteraceae bacterium]|nr:polysaccharide biosynthesis tyrosine autokinase [Paludibacteraceae bacterium]